MPNLNEIAQWDPTVAELETTDLLRGGAGGELNRQAQALANRSAWTKQVVNQQWATDPANTAGLNYFFFGGTALDASGNAAIIAGGSIALLDNDTNYVERTYDGIVSRNDTGFTATRIGMAKVVTAAGKITSIEDWRPMHGAFPYYPIGAAETGVTDVRYPVGDLRRYGAIGDGDAAHAAVNSTAFNNAHSSIPSPGEILVAAGCTFMMDSEHYITKTGVRLRGGGWIKVPDNSTIYNDHTNPWGRYLIHVRADDFELDDVNFDFNSRGNSHSQQVTLSAGITAGDVLIHVAALLYDVPTSYTLTFVDGGVNKTVVTSAAAVAGATTISVAAAAQNVGNGSAATVRYYNNYGYGFAGVICGWYGPSMVGQADVNSPRIRNAKFYDGSQAMIDSYQQGFGNVVRGLRIHDCEFMYGQSVQVAFSCITDGKVSDCYFRSPYFACFQYYYSNTNCQFTDNVVFSQVAKLDLSKLDPTLYTGALLNYAGQIRVGKTDSHMNTACDVLNSRLFGATVCMLTGMQYSTVSGVRSYGSESVGFSYVAGTGKNNAITNCWFFDSDQPGGYLDTNSAGAPAVIEENHFIGCCRNTLATSYGGRQLNAQIVVWDSNYVLRRNYARKGTSTVAYGCLGSSTNVVPTIDGNDFTDSGNTQSVATNTNVWPPVLAPFTRLGALRRLEFWDPAMQSDGTLDTFFPLGMNARLAITVGSETGVYAVLSSGGVTTVTLAPGATANMSVTDTAGKVCLFPSGNRVNFRQRLGAAKPALIDGVFGT